MESGGAEYRLKVARGFRDEAFQDIGLGPWRSAMDNTQLAVENAAKAVVGPVGRTHNPALELRLILAKGVFDPSQHDQVQRLAELAEKLGPDVHVQTDYGNELEGLTPWELFDEVDARQACAMAETAVKLAQAIIREVK